MLLQQSNRCQGQLLWKSTCSLLDTLHVPQGECSPAGNSCEPALLPDFCLVGRIDHGWILLPVLLQEG